MESFLFQQHCQPFLLDCVYNYINENGDLKNISSSFTTYDNNSSDANHDSSSSSLSSPRLSSEKKRKHSNHSSYSSTGQSKVFIKSKINKKKQLGVPNKEEAEKKPKNNKELISATAEQKSDYIHVRARRGQATDSHSLAERVRRERISERMKKLQDLVPGCDKVIGKALVLDEIINYVQSLQNQVEFLSMKLASSNPILYDFGGEIEDRMGQREEIRSISHSMPSVIQSNHIQTTAYEGAINSLQPAMYGQGPSTFSQNGGNILMQIGLSNTCYFQ